MLSKFFIDRPVFAWVISIVIMLAGILGIHRLPIEQYPQIAPPSVSIRASYPGASAQTLEDSVTQIIEQKMNGIDHLRYFSSTSDSSGNVNLTLTFDPEANPDIAQVQVQNKLQLALPLLPQEVQQRGVVVTKSNKSFLLVAAFTSTDGKISREELGDYLSSKVQDSISRLNGVGDVTIFGPPHAMRIWLDPNKMYSYKVTTTDIQNAIKAQNDEVSAGQLGGMPAVAGQQINATITAQSRLKTPEDFENILLRVNPDGSQLKLKDVARVELGADSYEVVGRFNRNPASGIAVSLATGANALDTAKEVREKLAELEPFLPKGVEVSYPYDTTPFVKLSIDGVVQTLIEAVGLVFLVILLFLQNFRATLIPTIAVPIVLLGTFAVLSILGFSINTLTMFAMVLAIGLLVDDAIVVIENVERVMAEEGLSPREATRKSMDQITGALIAIALVLSAVFVPMAFFPGSTGAIYRQFSVTIVTAMLLSVLVALILTPSLCATILKSNGHDAHKGFFGLFNRGFDASRTGYAKSAHHVTRHPVAYFLVYAAIVGGLGFLFMRLPTSFLPDEDQGLMFVQVMAPAGATTERTLDSVKKVENYFLDTEKENVDSIFTVVGFSFSGRSQSSAMAFVRLKDWSVRKRPEQKVFAIADRAMGALSAIKGAQVFAFAPPAVTQLGNASGFDMELLDRAGVGHAALEAARNELLGMAAQNKKLSGVRPNGLSDTPEYKIDIDREKAGALGLSFADINNTLSAAWGSSYVNDFVDAGRVKKVYIQADAPFRMMPQDLDDWYVRNNKGEMVPFSTFSTAHWTYGSPRLERYNGIPALEIQGSPAPGVSSGEAMKIMESYAKKLPSGIGYAWTGLSYEERLSGAQAPALYAVSVLVVFLCLAALYESWSIPFAVMLVVPLGVIGAVTSALLRGLANDVYFQVGLLTTIGLSAKNAILIVEFAKDMYEKDGKPLIEAALDAAEQRLRPIVMTSLAFILGVLPFAISTGAGSGSQNAIGVGVMGGMFSATFLAIFFVPLFYIFTQAHLSRKKRKVPQDGDKA